MAKSTKKKSSAKKPAARKARPTHKDRLKRPVSKKVAKTTKAGKRLSPNKTTTESPAVFLGLNHRERRLDPFIRQQKEKLLHLREAIPFARFTVECQSQLEKLNKASRVRQSVTSLFGLTEEEGGEAEEEEATPAEVKE